MDMTVVMQELMHLSPTTREKAMQIAQDLLQNNDKSTVEAFSLGIVMARDWAVKNVNINLWKRLKTINKESDDTY